MKKDYWNYAKYANFAFSFGVTMAASIFLGYFGGNWLDRKFKTAPYLMLAGILLGVGVAFYSLMKELFLLEKLKPPGQGVNQPSLKPEQKEDKKDSVKDKKD